MNRGDIIDIMALILVLEVILFFLLMLGNFRYFETETSVECLAETWAIGDWSGAAKSGPRRLDFSFEGLSLSMASQ